MTWTYKQSTGELFHDGRFIERGYSGRMTNKNNPDRQHVKALGPLPRGTYRINGYSNSKGPQLLFLIKFRVKVLAEALSEFMVKEFKAFPVGHQRVV